MKSLLIIFVKNPQLGKVKSRLAKSIGEGKALIVYKKLLRKTRELVVDLEVDKLICYSNRIEHQDLYDNRSFQKAKQVGDNLGDKMYNSIQQASINLYKKICLIGSDNMELTDEIIRNAFEYLNDYDIVIGPAKDGGYYLIGMKTPKNEIFDLSNWGTSSVLEETLKIIQDLGLKYILLPVLNDIDVAEDISESDRDFLLS